MKDRRSKIYCNIDATATAGVLLALLLVLWSTFPGSDLLRSGSVELVKSNNSALVPGARREDALAVGLSASGDVYFRSKHIHIGELEGMLRDGLKHGAENRVYLNADSRARYLDVKLVLSRISAAGIQDITIISQ
jgi:biopolymer transport protein ExbD